MALVSLRMRARRSGEAPLPLVAIATAIALAMLLPAAYLLIRVAEEGSGALDAAVSASARAALVRTALLAASVAASTIVLAVPLAWLTARTDLPLRRMWAVLLVLPLAIPSYVGAFTIIAALGPRGMLQDALSPFGVESLPELYGFRGAWLALTLFTYPYVLLPVRAAIRNLDRSMEEAGRSLGRGRLGVFVGVTLPQLRPAMASGAVLVALYTLSDFGAVSLLRFDSLSRLVYVRYTQFDRGSAAALALLLVGLTIIVVATEAVVRGRGRYHANFRHATSPPVRLGLWTAPALLFCSSVVAAALVLPMSVIAYWLWRGIDAGSSVSFDAAVVWNSFYASGLAALIAAACALPVCVLAVRYPGALSALVERAAYSGYALPGITVALALVFFGANYAPIVYQTLALLLFAYAVRFLPQAISSCRSALLQVNPNGERAARGMGKGRLAVFTRVTLPQILPGVAGGALLVFLSVIKELPVTLLLSPIGFETLATRIWSSTSEAFFARAALPALIMVAISAVPVLVTVWREERA